MKFLKLPDNSRYSTRAILIFIIPIFIEQVMLNAMAFVDSLMVARSSAGEVAMAGMELVKHIDILMKQVFIALATGGSVVLSMYIGAKDKKHADVALKLCIWSFFIVSGTISIVMMVFRTNLLTLLYPTAETEVMEQAINYFFITILAYPLTTLYYTCSACFRSMKKSNITLYGSFLMIAINLITKYVFIFMFDMGIIGAGLSALIAFGVVGIIMLIMLHSQRNEIYIDNIFKFQWDGRMSKRIFSIGVPNGIENGMFQLGALILQQLVVSLGTTAILANSLGHNLICLMYSMSNTFTLAMSPFVGQCIGAGKSDEAVFYTKYILKLEYIFLLINFVLIMPLIRPVALVFHISPEATEIGVFIMITYAISSITLHPLSFALANALRSVGDVKFTMSASIVSMFAFRIGFAYLLVHVFHMGVEAIWYAMYADWVIRGSVFVIRFKRGKWKNIKVI